jgi:hypothetical protein
MANTHGLKPEEVLCALYVNSQPVGMGVFSARRGGMTLEEARSLINGDTYFDYLLGRVLKLKIRPGSDSVEESMYDRDNGAGAAQRALDDYFTSTPEERKSKYHTV